MGKRFIPRPTAMSELKNYFMITLGLTLYAFTWKFFMAPFKFVTGGITGVGGIVEYTTGIPMQYTYFAINIILLIIAIQQLGWKFCVKTIYAIVVMTVMLELFGALSQAFPQYTAAVVLKGSPLEACIVGSIFIGMGIAFCFLSNGSTGGVDIIAAIVNKYKDISFGRAMLYVDACIIISSFFIVPISPDEITGEMTAEALKLQKIFYGFINLVIVNVSLDYMVNSNRQAVQFFIFSSKYDEIAYYITRRLKRGVTLLDSVGYYSGKEGKVVTTIARATQANQLLSAIKQIDPNALVSQSKVMAVYGLGFDKIKSKKKVKIDDATSVDTAKTEEA
ncbi:MAG: YitT family protein [Bacteroidaceae bacterium]|nr:YitT family protein [Bacteroidaceae bacterium]